MGYKHTCGQIATDIFFLGRVFLGPRPICIQILMPSPYSYLPELATTGLIAGAHTGAHLSSLRHRLQEKPTCPPPKGEPTFYPTLVGEMAAPLFPPSDADFVFSDIRGRNRYFFGSSPTKKVQKLAFARALMCASISPTLQTPMPCCCLRSGRGGVAVSDSMHVQLEEVL